MLHWNDNYDLFGKSLFRTRIYENVYKRRDDEAVEMER